MAKCFVVSSIGKSVDSSLYLLFLTLDILFIVVVIDIGPI